MRSGLRMSVLVRMPAATTAAGEERTVRGHRAAAAGSPRGAGVSTFARAWVRADDPGWLRDVEREVHQFHQRRAQALLEGEAAISCGGVSLPPRLSYFLDGGCRRGGALRDGTSLLHELGLRGTVPFTRRVRDSSVVSNVMVHAVPSCALGLCGGGGDGGSTGAEDRKAYLEMYAEKKDRATADKSTVSYNRYTSCAVSGALLRSDAAVVVDAVGQLIDKEALVRRMLDGSLQAMSGLGHIRSLKDVIDVRLTRMNADNDEDGKAGGIARERADRGSEAGPVNFCCPVLGLPLNGRYKFCFLKRHGVLVSERALRDAREAVEEMVGVKLSVRRDDDGGFAETDDLLTMYPSEELAEERRARAVERRQREKLARKMEKKAGRKKDHQQLRGEDGKRKQEHEDDSDPKRPKVSVSHGDESARCGNGSRSTAAGSDVYKSIFHKGGAGSSTETFTFRNTGARGFK